METRGACFLGHRSIRETEEVKRKLFEVVEKLIVEEGIDVFLFGSRSAFDDLAYAVVTSLKNEKYPDIRRVYVRAEYPDIREDYERYLLKRFEETEFPERIKGAGRAAYVERNREMVDRSRVCVFYCCKKEEPITRRSGTKIAFDYALRRGKTIINLALSAREE